MFDDPKGLMSKANIRDKWELPIQITLMKDLESAVREHQENAIFAEVKQAIGVDIDKKRLMDALEYSHQSWLDGYAAGQKDAVKHGHWMLGYGFYPAMCSVCKMRARTPGYIGD